MTRPEGSTKPEMPVRAARANQRCVSAARSRTWAKCWRGAHEKPYQPSLVRVTRSSAPARVSAAAKPGKTTSKQIATPSGTAAGSSTGAVPGVKAPTSRTRLSAKAKLAHRGTYSPNGTRWTLS